MNRSHFLCAHCVLLGAGLTALLGLALFAITYWRMR